jgi:hypothetical protein
VIQEFRGLIERGGEDGKLTDSSHMAKLIPLFGKAYDETLKGKKFVSLGAIFDGLSDKGNWVSVLIRGVLEGEEMILEQHLLDMPHTSSPYNHAVLNKILLKAFGRLLPSDDSDDDAMDIDAVNEPPSKGSSLIKFLIHDDAEVNNCSCRFLIEGLFVGALDIDCLCHVLSRVGGALACTTLKRFDSIWLIFFKNADKRKHLFRRLTGLSLPSRNKIKWHSAYKYYSFYSENLPRITNFVTSPDLRTDIIESKSDLMVRKGAELALLLCGDQASAKTVAESVAKESGIEDRDLIQALVVSERARAADLSRTFKMELAAVVDGAYPLIFSTYAIEGDGVTIFFAHELWKASSLAIQTFAEGPEKVGEVKQRTGLLLTNKAVWENDLDRVKEIFEPAWAYMQAQSEKHANTLKFLEVVNGLCPWNAKALTPESLQYLVDIHLLTLESKVIIENNELPLYHFHGPTWDGAVRPTFPEYYLRDCITPLLPEARIWRFWYVFQRKLKNLNHLVRTIAAAQCHSAAAERTGSLFTHDKTSQSDSVSVNTAVIRQRAHYAEVVNPMRNMPLDGLTIL